MPPIQVRRTEDLKKIPINDLFKKIKFFTLTLLGLILNKYKDTKANTKANTPILFWGIDRKIAYTYKKYHSGLIWRGEVISLASK